MMMNQVMFTAQDFSSCARMEGDVKIKLLMSNFKWFQSTRFPYPIGTLLVPDRYQVGTK